MKEQHLINEFYIDMSRTYGIQTIIGIDSHYLSPKGFQIQQMLHKIGRMSAKNKKDKEGEDEGWTCKELYLKTFPDILNDVIKWKIKIL